MNGYGLKFVFCVIASVCLIAATSCATGISGNSGGKHHLSRLNNSAEKKNATVIDFRTLESELEKNWTGVMIGLQPGSYSGRTIALVGLKRSGNGKITGSYVRMSTLADKTLGKKQESSDVFEAIEYNFNGLPGFTWNGDSVAKLAVFYVYLKDGTLFLEREYRDERHRVKLKPLPTQ